MTHLLELTVANSTTQHSHDGYLCSTPKWYEVLVFFLANYVAHAATIVTYPGESMLSTVLAICFALLFPGSGVVRGLSAMFRHGNTYKSRVDRATRAGALCMVVRTKDWAPQSGVEVRDIVLRQKSEFVAEGQRTWLAPFRTKKHEVTLIGNLQSITKEHVLSYQLYTPPWAIDSLSFWGSNDSSHGYIGSGQPVHGYCVLAEGYKLARVPSDAVILPREALADGADARENSETMDDPDEPVLNPEDTMQEKCEISANFNAAKLLFALIQLCFATITVVRNSATEISDNGYGSYSLTVLQYAWMSGVNFIGLLINPVYPTLFLVESEVMREAIRRKQCLCDGVIGKLSEVDIEGFGPRKTSGRFHYDSTQQMPTTSGLDSTFTPCESTTSLRRRSMRFTPARESRLIPSISRHTMQESGGAESSETRLPSFDASQAPSWNTSYGLDQSPERDTQMPSLFVPTCPAFERKKHPRYRVWFTHNFKQSNGTYEFSSGATSDTPMMLLAALSFVLASVPFIAIAGKTKFDPGDSTPTDRGVFTTWLVLGIFICLTPIFLDLEESPSFRTFLLVMQAFLYGFPAIWGFVKSAQLQLSYGTCLKIR